MILSMLAAREVLEEGSLQRMVIFCWDPKASLPNTAIKRVSSLNLEVKDIFLNRNYNERNKHSEPA